MHPNLSVHYLQRTGLKELTTNVLRLFSPAATGQLRASDQIPDPCASRVCVWYFACAHLPPARESDRKLKQKETFFHAHHFDSRETFVSNSFSEYIYIYIFPIPQHGI